VRPPWEGLSTHFTKEFEAFALRLMRELPMSQVGELVGETDTRLWRMLFRQVEAAYAEADFSQVCCVGVAERSVRKGHESISVFADLVRKRVRFATEGKDQGTWVKFVGGTGKTQWTPAGHHAGEPGHEPGLSDRSRRELPQRPSGIRQVSCD
jgi:transposase